jgi:hypothetical protein
LTSSLIQNGTKQEVDENSNNNSDPTKGVESTASIMQESLEVNHARLAELLKQIAEESRRLATTRAELQKAKRVTISSTGGSKSGNDTSKKTTSSKDDEVKTENRKGAEKKGVPEHLLPELCQLLARSGADGIIKVQEKFISLYPNISKRQIELEAQRLAVKEKQGKDSMKVWHIRPEYEYLLQEKGSSSKSSSNSDDSKTPKSFKKKSAITDYMVKGSNTPSTGNKRKHSSTTPGSSEQKKKSKPKTAFQLYVKENRAAAEASLGADSAADTAILKSRLLEMWHALKDTDRAKYDKQEADEKAKFEKAMSGSSKKKTKR